MWCSSSAIQASAVPELYVSPVPSSFCLSLEIFDRLLILNLRAAVVFPPQLRISSLVPVSMEALQKLATEHQLPAVNLAPIPSSQLSDAIRNDLLAVGSNEDLYSMFAKSMDQRKTVSCPSLALESTFSISLPRLLAFTLRILTPGSQCGIVKFGPTPSMGMVILSIPNQSRFVGIVFQRTPLPESWLHPTAPPALALQQQQQQQLQNMQQQPNLFAVRSISSSSPSNRVLIFSPIKS